jgi:hypothetical protein
MSSHFLLPRHFQQAASSAITLLHPSNKQPVLQSHFCIPEQAAIFATTPLSTSSQFCHHTFASLEQAASFVATLLHPSSEQPVLLPHFCIPRASSYFCCYTTSNREPVLLPHFCILEQAAVSAATPFPTRSQFCSHTFASFKQAAISAATLFILDPPAWSYSHTISNKAPFLLPHFCILRTSSYIWYRTAIFAVTPLSTSSQFCSHTFTSFKQAAISAATLFIL